MLLAKPSGASHSLCWILCCSNSAAVDSAIELPGHCRAHVSKHDYGCSEPKAAPQPQHCEKDRYLIGLQVGFSIQDGSGPQVGYEKDQ